MPKYTDNPDKAFNTPESAHKQIEKKNVQATRYACHTLHFALLQHLVTLHSLGNLIVALHSPLPSRQYLDGTLTKCSEQKRFLLKTVHQNEYGIRVQSLLTLQTYHRPNSEQ